MKNNVMIKVVSGLFLLTTVATAQNNSDLAFANTKFKAPTTITKCGLAGTISAAEIVDYPTVSYPEAASLAVEKDKAFYHLSWQVIMPENLSYTEVQSSTDGKNFSTVGYVTNESTDYFVPSDKSNSNTSFRLVQYSLNAQKHISEVVKLK